MWEAAQGIQWALRASDFIPGQPSSPPAEPAGFQPGRKTAAQAAKEAPAPHRSAMIPSLASKSSEAGSMPFWLITTKLLPSAHTWRRGGGRASVFS